MTERRKRRELLQSCLRATLAVPVIGYVWAGCKSTKKSTVSGQSTKKPNPCEDLAGVPAVEVEKRKSLGYTSVSPMPDSQCNNCKLYIPQKEGAECGGCLLFAGSVSPEGYCTYWAPIV